jgi:hypothetical protein
MNRQDIVDHCLSKLGAWLDSPAALGTAAARTRRMS